MAVDVRIRRYFPAFIRACETVCLIHSFNLPEKRLRRQRKLEISFADYAVTEAIFNKAFAESLHRPSDRALKTRVLVEKIVAQNGGKPVGAADLAREAGISKDRAYARLRRAAKAGTIRKGNPPAQSNRKLYLPAPEPRFMPDPVEVFPKLGLRGPVKFIHPLIGKWVICGRGGKKNP